MAIHGQCCGRCHYYAGPIHTKLPHFCDAPLPDSILCEDTVPMRASDGRNCKMFELRAECAADDDPS